MSDHESHIADRDGDLVTEPASESSRPIAPVRPLRIGALVPAVSGVTARPLGIAVLTPFPSAQGWLAYANISNVMFAQAKKNSLFFRAVFLQKPPFGG
jgi:hypothetical protein